ncbi:MAG: hypothetical protein H3C64_08145 [Candidatus Kuenenia stuttgartiensis]|uniref:Uncharacterized protein n=1 Tax=Kuenenia stuttgartiensis TaxID=174633 RepID=A0A2C9CJ62_KUEST|nr:CsgG/HfaB family protein [Candidatus Kuenenia stuttgartiensis]MBW7942354.1 hypothetical protein [Candidatus Kuenenia stuttgartiensis]MBZ0192726.1 CsgG/HfaB family protein [Candidatus Kuenenia stuttgartiensis]MCL4726874.1 hypothetical protein [Candidatus Kuenenia stuttgartiensis]SOH05638.1 hypothetical protein KSMBR1_3161 [Candidatus Kuenenia stuttgartiensis]
MNSRQSAVSSQQIADWRLEIADCEQPLFFITHLEVFVYRRISVSIIFLILLSGCISSPKITRYSGLSYNKSEELRVTHLQRVLLLPFEYTIDREAVIDEIAEAFSVELRKIGRFEVVVLEGKAKMLSENKIWDKGSINLNTVLQLRKKYDVDAIVFGAITHYRPYEPMLLGVKAGMVSTDTGTVLWSADGVYDSNENEVAELVKYYFESTHQKSALYGWKLILLSMRRYSQFVANQITKTLLY